MNSICTTFEARASWGIPGTAPTPPATLSTAPADMAALDCQNIMGSFNAAFVCTISLGYLYDADGMALKDLDGKTLITE